LAVEPLRLGVAVRHPDHLEEAAPIRIAVDAAAVDGLPIAVHDSRGRLITMEGEVGVEEVPLHAPVPRLEAARTRDPYRWMGFLDRPRPDIDIAQLGVFAVERERLVGGPGPQDQPDPLPVLVSKGHRVGAVAERTVLWTADREAC